MKVVASTALLCGCLFSTHVLAGGVPATRLDDMAVTGQKPVTALSASEGVVSQAQLAARPVARVAELLEFVPGMIATQHSGEGKGNQYFLRGFNLDHGTDFATFVDGMPVNLRSHGHGQGYSDINFLIPELVDTLRYSKGPYHADVGDFSAAGHARFSLQNSLDSNLLKLAGGENGYGRALATGSLSVGSGQLLLAADVSQYDGPWVLDQDLATSKALVRYSRGQADNGYSLTLMGYDSQWDATDQIPARAVNSGQIDRLGFIDPDVGGDSSRYSLSFNLQRPRDNGHWQMSAYAIDYAMELYSNFTYFLEDPSNGDEFEQLDERRVYGLSTQRQWDAPWVGPAGTIRLGAQLRHDAISAVGLFNTQARQRLSTVRLDEIDETSLGLYGELQLMPLDGLRVTAGLRVDGYRFDVASDEAANSGDTDDTIVSPKLSLAWAANDKLDLFLNVGRGFHSNDARGTVIQVDPASASNQAVDSVQPLVAADALDMGLVAHIGSATHVSATLWALELDSELVYSGDGGATEASAASRRYGLELAAYATPTPWLIVDMDYAWSHARLDIDGPDDRIPNAVEQVASLGATLMHSSGLSAGVRVRHLGKAPLVEDNSVRSDSTTLVNLEAEFAVHPQLSVGLGVFNLFDSNDNDITYYYASRLQGEPAEGVEDVHFHPVEPRQLRANLSWRF